ncbi:MAG: glycosyl hydrolase 108 family protein [bacterium]|nr:glycosyl hydrolase 108 family protein [bacterium]
MTTFEKALVFVFGSEGGYSDHPNDRGGATNMGITSGTLARAFSQKIVGYKDIKALTRADAAEIYRAFYWRPSKADKMPEPLCILHFDAAVNHGLGGSARLMQRAINNYAIKAGLKLYAAVDGELGPKSLSALDVCVRHKNNLRLICEIYLNEREKYFREIVVANPSQACFLKGWLNRIAKNRRLLS